MACHHHVKQEYDHEQYESELPSPRPPPSESPALPLFDSNRNVTNLSAFSDSTLITATPTITQTRFAKARGFFSTAQWQELELQALIFKYMLVKAPVPANLIEAIKKSLPDNNPAFYLHHPFQLYHQQKMLRSGYWGNAVDPEPGRCRRTDGKKWRCAKDVVVGQKYCERHMHRGRNRSRKPVEMSTLPIGNGRLGTAALYGASPSTRKTTGIHFALAMPASSPLSPRYPEIKQEKDLSVDQCNDGYVEDRTDDGQTLRHFFDDWPRSQQEPNGINLNASSGSSATGLSISIPCDHHPLSDFSLKLATGKEDLPSCGERKPGGEQIRLVSGAGWGNNQMSSMGGPLAEALRQSGSSSSPTSVLLGELSHQRSGLI